MSAQPYVSRSRRVSIAELEPFIERTVEELERTYETAGDSFTLYHGEVNEDADGPVEVCVPTSERVDGGGGRRARPTTASTPGWRWRSPGPSAEACERPLRLLR